MSHRRHEPNVAENQGNGTDPQQLRHPLKLRLVLCLTIIGAWYFSFFTPLAKRRSTTAAIARERKRIATAKEIETLKKALAPYHGLIPAGANLSELMRHVIDHLRSSPLKLIDLKPEAPRISVPTRRSAFSWRSKGAFAEIDAFLSWVETDGRHFRVDSIKIDPNQQDHGQLKAQ